MAKISFTLFESTTLSKLKFLDVPQAEAVLDVSGPFTDPNSLQKFRDAIQNSFASHRKNLAELVGKQDEEMGKIRDKKEQSEQLKVFRKQQEAAVKRVEKILQEKVDLVKQKAGESANALALKESQVTVSVVWSLYKLGKGAVELLVPGDSPDPVSQVEQIAGTVKTLYDALKELIKLAGTLSDSMQSEYDVRSQIEGTRKQIRVAKGKPTESLVNKLEAQLKAHGPKIAAIERSARELAKGLESMLNQAEKAGKGLRATQLRNQLAPSIDTCIQQIIALNEGLEKATDYHSRSQDALKSAQKTQVKDPSSFWDYFKKIDEWYEWVDELFSRTKASTTVEVLEVTADKMVKEFTE